MFNSVINFPKIHVDFVDEVMFIFINDWFIYPQKKLILQIILIVKTWSMSWLNVPWQQWIHI
jgi:hypothetical protein